MNREAALAGAAEHFDSGAFVRDLARRVAYKTESQDAASGPHLHAYLADELVPSLAPLGFTTQVFDNPVPPFGPLLIATRHEDDALPTVLMYGHGSRIARVLHDGSLDGSFAPAFDGQVLALALQTNQIVVGGGFTALNVSTPVGRITRLNPDGTVDTGFVPGVGGNDFVATISLQSDGTEIRSCAQVNSDHSKVEAASLLPRYFPLKTCIPTRAHLCGHLWGVTRGDPDGTHS